MIEPFTQKIYVQPFPVAATLYFVGDIGGTNSNFGVCYKQGTQMVLLFSLQIKSKCITNFADTVHAILAYLQQHYSWQFDRACIAAAGEVDDYLVQPTNAAFAIDAQEIMHKTGLKQVLLINDFQAVGFGFAQVDPTAIVPLNAVQPRAQATKGFIGAGTGLGKTIGVWDELIKTYNCLPSEGGHADCAVQTQQELDLIAFIRTYYGVQNAVSWEEVLSGRGIIAIYNFLGATRNYKPTEYSARITENRHPDEIIKYHTIDQQCADTVELFITFYARCAKDFALNLLAYGGVYLAGGIAANNVAMLQQPAFMREFLQCEKQRDVLEKIPVFVIADYNVSLYGAAVYSALMESKFVSSVID